MRHMPTAKLMATWNGCHAAVVADGPAIIMSHAQRGQIRSSHMMGMIHMVWSRPTAQSNRPRHTYEFMCIRNPPQTIVSDTPYVSDPCGCTCQCIEPSRLLDRLPEPVPKNRSAVSARTSNSKLYRLGGVHCQRLYQPHVTI